MTGVSNTEVKSFWEANPVAAEGIAAPVGTPEFFKAFDVLREADDCEPWNFSDQIHGYSKSAGQRVLDVGCGNGYVLAQYAKFGADVAGVDLTQTAIELCKTRFALAGLKGDFRLPMATGCLSRTALSISPARWACCITSRTLAQ
jgi:SAM-dependent methyltransferase